MSKPNYTPNQQKALTAQGNAAVSASAGSGKTTVMIAKILRDLETTDIENILIYNNQGKAVRIKDVGTVVERFNPPTIERKDRERVNTVQARKSTKFSLPT